jgi:hypothetical protein
MLKVLKVLTVLKALMALMALRISREILMFRAIRAVEVVEGLGASMSAGAGGITLAASEERPTQDQALASAPIQGGYQGKQKCPRLRRNEDHLDHLAKNTGVLMVFQDDHVEHVERLAKCTGGSFEVLIAAASKHDDRLGKNISRCK